MVCGFFGTLISLERAVALGRRWAYVGPILCGSGGLILIASRTALVGPVLLTLGSFWYVLVFYTIVRKHPAQHTYMMGLGGLSWLAGNILWILGGWVYQVVPWWAGFLVLTIAGERLELGRIVRLSKGSQVALRALVGGYLAGLLISLLWFSIGIHIIGAMQIALAIWFLRFDIARLTVRKSGLTRYIAVCLLTGYFWLGISGLIGLIYGGVSAGAQYDAMLHALFFGFVFSMTFGHAPIIFPAVLNRPVAYKPWFYLPLVLLHFSLILRIVGDLGGMAAVRLWGGILNATAILLCLGILAASMFRISE